MNEIKNAILADEAKEKEKQNNTRTGIKRPFNG